METKKIENETCMYCGLGSDKIRLERPVEGGEAVCWVCAMEYEDEIKAQKDERKKSKTSGLWY